MKASLYTFFILVFCSTALFGGIKENADRCFFTGQVLMGKSNDYGAGDEKNACLQKARALFDHALELYDRYIEQHPEKAASLDARITEINANRFWCNRLTTLTFNKSSLPTVEKILQEEGVDLLSEEEGEQEKAPPKPKLEEIIAASKKPLTKEEAQKIAIESMKRDFLNKIRVLVSKRLIANAQIQCRRMLRYKDIGIPPEFFNQILTELDYIEVFFSSVFDNAMQMEGKKITLAKTIHDVTIEGVVDKFDKGMLHIRMEGKGIEMGIPLFNFSDGFLIRNVSRRSKDVMTGIGSFFLLEGRMDYARNTFTKLAGMEGKPEDLSPFMTHIQQIDLIHNSAQKEKVDSKALDYSMKQLGTAIMRFKRKDYDGALKYMHKMYAKAGENMDILLQTSNKAFEETERYLPEFVEELLEGCPVCSKSRKMKCPGCRGAGRYKIRGKWKWCPACKGEKEIECQKCFRRMNDKKNKHLHSEMRRLFKRTENQGDDGEKEELKKEIKRVGDRIPL